MSVERMSSYRACIIAAAALAVTGLASASGAMAAPVNHLKVDSAYADGNGNLVIYGQGGEKIIVVGAADKAKVLAKAIDRNVPIAERRSGAQIVTAPRDPHVVAVVDTRSSYCGGPVVIRGRSFMYGIDRNDTPVLGQPGC